VARTPCIPPELTKRPFSLEEARSAGLTLSALRGKVWRRLGAELYCWSGLREDPLMLLRAWRGLLPTEAVFAGATAAWLLGLDLRPTNPVEIVVPGGSGIRSRDGLRVRRCEIPRGETVTVRGLRATALHRTLSDLSLQWPPVEALVAIDMAVRLGLTDAAGLGRYAVAMQGRAGARRLRSLATYAAPAESPMETRLRWLLVQAGLPRPEIQTDLYDPERRFVGRADLYYPAARLVLEYDGGNHRERLVEDDRRQNLLINAGFRLLRFTAADIHGRPDVVVAQVRGALDVGSHRTFVVKRAQKGRGKRTVGAKEAESDQPWWRGVWRRGRDSNSRWASDP
jgi:Protein of unknown function (DUF559)